MATSMATSPSTVTTAGAKRMMDDEYSVLSVSTVKVSNSFATGMRRIMEIDNPEVLRGFLAENRRERDAALAQRDAALAQRDAALAEVAQLRGQLAQRDAEAGQFQEGVAVEGLVAPSAAHGLSGEFLGLGVADQGVVGTGLTPLPEAAVLTVETDSEESEAVAPIAYGSVKTDSEESEAVAPIAMVTVKSDSEESEEFSALTTSTTRLPPANASVGSASQTDSLVASTLTPSLPSASTGSSLAGASLDDSSTAGEEKKGSN